MSEQTFKKPPCKLVGEDGNVFNLIGIATRVLKKHGLVKEAAEMRERCFKSSSYVAALGVICEYVDVH